MRYRPTRERTMDRTVDMARGEYGESNRCDLSLTLIVRSESLPRRIIGVMWHGRFWNAQLPNALSSVTGSKPSGGRPHRRLGHDFGQGDFLRHSDSNTPTLTLTWHGSGVQSKIDPSQR